MKVAALALSAISLPFLMEWAAGYSSNAVIIIPLVPLAVIGALAIRDEVI